LETHQLNGVTLATSLINVTRSTLSHDATPNHATNSTNRTIGSMTSSSSSIAHKNGPLFSNILMKGAVGSRDLIFSWAHQKRSRIPLVALPTLPIANTRRMIAQVNDNDGKAHKGNLHQNVNGNGNDHDGDDITILLLHYKRPENISRIIDNLMKQVLPHTNGHDHLLIFACACR
jgi:hypothetical protein